MNEYFDDGYYQMWNEHALIADCLRKYRLDDLAKGLHTESVNSHTINSYINLIKEIAEKRKDNDVLDRLCFSGLIYG